MEVRRQPGWEEERRSVRPGHLAAGTLACPSCDAPVAPHGVLTPGEPLACPLCDHAGRVREFLSLEAPSRPAHVVVRVVVQSPGGWRTT